MRQWNKKEELSNRAELEAELTRLREALTAKNHQIITLFDTIDKVIGANNLTQQLELVAQGIVEARLFKRAIISLLAPDFSRVDVGYAGLTKDEIAMHRQKPSLLPEIWKEILSDRYKIGNSYFISHTSGLNRRISAIESHLDEREFSGGWHPNDMLFIPFYDTTGKLLGIISVDDPFDGALPTPESLRIPELFAREASALIERTGIHRKLLEAKEYLVKLIESSADIIVTTDISGKIVVFNKAAERILGYRPEEIIGESVTIIYADEAEARKVMRIMRESGGRIESVEVMAKAKSGEEIPISLSAVILYDADGNEIGTEGISKDLRPIKALQQRIIELERKETIIRIVVTLTHLINTQLHALISRGKNLEEMFRSGKVSCVDNNALAIFEKYLSEMKSKALKISEITEKLEKSPDKLGEERYLRDLMMFVPDESGISLEQEKSPPPKLGPKRILVVDDDITILESTAEFLRSKGYIVDTAIDGFEALEYIYNDSNKFDAIVSDIKMPGPSGYIVYSSAEEIDPDAIVILMTAFEYDPNHVLLKAKKTGLDVGENVLRKPFELDTLLDKLEKAFARKANQQKD